MTTANTGRLYFLVKLLGRTEAANLKVAEIVILSPNAVEADNVRDEVAFALDEGRQLVYPSCCDPSPDA